MKFSIALAGVLLAAPALSSLYNEGSENHTCLLQPQVLSCSAQANPSSVDSCCSETFGGLLLATQYWDTYTGLEDKGQLLPPQTWTLHGLWPDFCNGSFTQYCDLGRQYDPSPSPNTTIAHHVVDPSHPVVGVQPLITEYEQNGLPNGTVVPSYSGPGIDTFVEAFGKYDLLAYMKKYWVSQGGPSPAFWAHEFSKHATCYSTFDVPCYGPEYVKHQDVIDFLQTAIMYYRRLPTYVWLANKGITPSNSTTYTLSDMQAALTSAFGATPYIGCSGPKYNTTDAGKGSTDSGQTVVSEVWYYQHVYGRPQEGRSVPVNATLPNTSCAKAPKALKYYLRTPSSLYKD